MSQSTAFRFSLFGGCQGIPAGINGSLLGLLLLAPDRAWTRKELAHELWGDGEREESVSARLRTALHGLRKHLDTIAPGSSTAILADAQTIKLDWARVGTDVQEFQRWLGRAAETEESDKRIEALRKALLLYQGDLLPGSEHASICALRDVFNENAFRALDQLITEARRTGSPEAVLTEVERFMSLYPFDESLRSRHDSLLGDVERKRATAYRSSSKPYQAASSQLAPRPGWSLTRRGLLGAAAGLGAVGGTLAWRRSRTPPAIRLISTSTVVPSETGLPLESEFPISLLPAGETCILVTHQQTKGEDVNIGVCMLRDRTAPFWAHSLNEPEDDAQLPRCAIFDSRTQDIYVGGATCRSHGSHGKDLPKHRQLWQFKAFAREGFAVHKPVCAAPGTDEEIKKLVHNQQSSSLVGLLSRIPGSGGDIRLGIVTDWRGPRGSRPIMLPYRFVNDDYCDLAVFSRGHILVALTSRAAPNESAQSDAIVVCLNPNGTTRWAANLGTGSAWDTRVCKMVEANGQVLVGYNSRRRRNSDWTENAASVASIDIETGRIKWDVKLNRVLGWGHVIADMKVVNNRLFVIRNGPISTITSMGADGSFTERALFGDVNDLKRTLEAKQILEAGSNALAICGTVYEPNRTAHRAELVDIATLETMGLKDFPFQGDLHQMKACVMNDGRLLLCGVDNPAGSRHSLMIYSTRIGS